jgi:hypothetical protein
MGKGRLGVAVGIEGEMVQVEVEYIMVALVYAATCGG